MMTTVQTIIIGGLNLFRNNTNIVLFHIISIFRHGKKGRFEGTGAGTKEDWPVKVR